MAGLPPLLVAFEEQQAADGGAEQSTRKSGKKIR